MNYQFFNPEKTITLPLVSDARISPVNPYDDQIWELRYNHNKDQQFYLHTTFGLRAREMQLRPIFSKANTPYPEEQSKVLSPELIEYSPDYVSINLYPFEGLKVTHKIRISDHNQVSGRFTFLNTGKSIQDIKFSWIAELVPGDLGEPMKPATRELTNILSGKTENLAPVLFFTGGPEGSISPFPSLNHMIYLNPGEKRVLTWALTSLESEDASYQASRITASANWPAEVARIRMAQKSQIQVHTSNSNWNRIINFSQHLSQSLNISNRKNESRVNFLKTRNPDQGYSYRGDGSDYAQQWATQTMLDCWYYCKIISPTNPERIKQIIRNFIQNRTSDNKLPNSLSFKSTSSAFRPTPLINEIVWEYYQMNADREFLSTLYPILLENLKLWYKDREVPAWETLRQTGYISNPLFVRWAEFGQGIDISKVISPDLLAFLYNEIQYLIKMANELNRIGAVDELEKWAVILKEKVETMWDFRASTFRYKDIDTEATQTGHTFGQFKGPGKYEIAKILKEPSRILIRLDNAGESTLLPDITIIGKDHNANNISETFERRDFQWFGPLSTLTTRKIFSEVTSISLKRISINNSTTLKVPNLKVFDHTLLIPLWAGMISQNHADKLITKTIMNEKRFGKLCGIPAIYTTSDIPENQAVWIPWNYMIIKGMVRYGYKAEALQLFTRLIESLNNQLDENGELNRYVNAENGKAFGEKYHLHNLLPTSLLLEIIGIIIRSPAHVEIKDYYPLEEEITVSLRGLIITASKDRIKIRLPNNEEVIIEYPVEDQTILIDYKKE